VTDGSAWRHPASHGGQPHFGGVRPQPPAQLPAAGAFGPVRSPYAGPGASWGYPKPADLRGPQPATTSWWSDALADPWRDPDAPVVVVKTPPSEPPPLEKPPPPSPGRTGLGLVLIVSIVTALLAGALGGTLGYVFAARGGGLPGVGNLPGGTGPLAQRPPDSIAGLVKKVLPSVVTIAIRSGSGASLGSGFVVSPDGYVVTNYHVIEGGTGDAVITFSDATVGKGTVVGGDPEADVAVVKIDKAGLPPDALKPVSFGDSEQVIVGDPVVAVGAPLGLSNTVTYGIVSYVDRPIRTSDGGTTRYYAAIQTDAAVNQGNSGGPLFDASGRVVGINSIIGTLAENRDSAGNVGLAFAIPINQARRVASEVIDTGKAHRTVIGATLDNTYRNLAGGAKLQSVDQSGPAAGAGLKAGDVIMSINGKPIEESWDVIALVRKYAPGSVVTVDYTRGAGGPRQKVSVTLVADAK
jgi:putative serine protease PepD